MKKKKIFFHVQIHFISLNDETCQNMRGIRFKKILLFFVLASFSLSYEEDNLLVRIYCYFLSQNNPSCSS